MKEKSFPKLWVKMLTDAAIAKAAAPTYRGPTPPNIGRHKRKVIKELMKIEDKSGS